MTFWSSAQDSSTKLETENLAAFSRLAGVAMLIAGAGYMALMVILVVVSRGHLPQSGQELLDYMSRRGLLVQVAMGTFILKDSCILVAFPLIALLLGGMRRPSLWVAVVIASLGMILDILSGLIVIAFRSFAEAYALVEPSLRAEYIPPVELVFRYVWRVETPFIVGLLSIAVLMLSRVMLTQERYGRLIPVGGIVLGVVGVLGATFGLIQPVLFLSIWYIGVALKLLRRNGGPARVNT